MKKILMLLCAGILMISMLCVSCDKKNSEPEQEEDTRTETWPGYEWQGDRKYYYAFDEKIYLDEVPGKVVLRFDEKHISEIEQSLQDDERVLQIKRDDFNKILILSIVEDADTNALIGDFKTLFGVKSANQVYMFAGFEGSDMYLTDEFVVKFKDNVSQQKIDEMHKKHGVEVKEDPYQYLFEKTHQLLSVPVDVDLLEVANSYQ